MVEPKYKRILIKLSGEALAGERGVGIDIKTVQKMALEIKEVHDLGIEIALVIGGGNLWRGEPAAEAGMDRVQADYTGMLGTVMNALGDGGFSSTGWSRYARSNSYFHATSR